MVRTSTQIVRKAGPYVAKIKIKVSAVRVLEESDELSSADEPFIIVFVADLANNQFGINLPNAKTTMHAWTDADEGELLTTVMADDVPDAAKKALKPFISFSEFCWGPDGQPAEVNDPDDLVILAGMMENDDGSPSAARSLVNGLMSGSLANMIGADLTRAEKVERLKKDMSGALEQARMTGAPNFDDRVGGVLEVRLTASDLDKAETKTVRKNITFDGGDEGSYRVGFDLVPA